MAATIFYLLMVLNLVCGWKKQSNKIILFVTIGMMLILMCYNTNGADVVGYRAEYNIMLSRPSMSNPRFEIGYEFVEYFFAKYFEADFYTFKLVVSIICFLLIAIRAYDYNVNLHLLLTMYMGYLFFMDTIQYRNFIASAIMVFSIKYLCEDGWTNVLKYIGLILFASFFHIISIFFLVFLLFKNTQMRRLNKMILVVGIGFLVFGSIFRSVISELSYAMMGFLSRGSGYLDTRTHGSFYALVIMHLMNVLLLWYLKRNRNKYILHVHEEKFQNMVWRMNCLLIFTLPLLMFSVSFYRMMRDVLILDYFVFAQNIDAMGKRTLERYRLGLIVGVIIVMWFIVDFTILNSYSNTVEPIFLYNKFWEI